MTSDRALIDKVGDGQLVLNLEDEEFFFNDKVRSEQSELMVQLRQALTHNPPVYLDMNKNKLHNNKLVTVGFRTDKMKLFTQVCGSYNYNCR